MTAPGPVFEASDPAASAAGSLLSYVPRLLRSWPDDAAHREFHGTLVSADLSGFTRLSERLAALGREGAEELTTLLNRVFTRMIAEVERFGGDVLKFGGDALLILYQGPNHTQRACASTIAMRHLVAEPLQTSTGLRVRLKISQGIHSGVFPCFILDGNHREMVVTGPDFTETVECEGTAVAGQILLSATAAANVDGRWLGRELDGRRLLRPLKDLDEWEAPQAATRTTGDISVFVPEVQRELIAIGAPAEHRRVAIGFVKFSHTDELFATEGADKLAARLDNLAGAVARAEHDFGVHWLASDVYPDGGKVILTAGAPVTFGDDEERMLRATRRILDEVHDLDLRIGVNVGPVFVGDLGSPNRRAFTVMGDAVNLAARLMQKADHGQLIASEATITRSATRFATAELEPFFVKGKTVPIRASVVGDPEAEREHAAGSLPLIGREQELEVLLDAAASASAGAGRVVEIVGEPGSGKSRLLEELRAREPDFALYAAQGGQYARATPYFAVRGFLRSIAGIPAAAGADDAIAQLTRFVDTVAPDLAQWLPLLAIPFDVDIPTTPTVERIAPQFRRTRSHQAVGDLLAAARSDPTLFLVEDLHWVDDASRDLIGELLARVQERPWLLVLTLRSEGTPFDAAGAARIDLEPLDGEAGLELVIAAAGHDSGLRPADWERLVERAGGNPLFAIELAEAARAQGSADVLADSVESLVTSRIDTLPARDRLLLRESAVLGAVVDTDLLATALEDDDVRRPGRWRTLDDFLVPDGNVLRFRHTIHQAVAYEGLSYRRRRDMHARAARAIRERVGDHTEGVVGLLATHYSRAGDHEATWEFAVKAGDEARGKYANIEAAEFYSGALAAARAVPHAASGAIAEVAESLGDVRGISTLYDEARRAYKTAREHAPAASTQWAELLRKEGRMLERQGRYTQALRAYSRARHALEALDGEFTDGTHARIYASYGSVRYWQGRLREAATWARRAIEAAEAARDRPALADGLRMLEVCLEELGDPERFEYWGRALAVYEELDDQVGIGDVLNNMGIAAASEGRLDESIDLFQRSMRARERAGDVVGGAGTSTNVAEVMFEQGRFAEARPIVERAERVFRASKHPAGIAISLIGLARLAAAEGSAEESLRLFDEALHHAEALGAAALVNELRVRRLEALVTLRRDDEALAFAEELATVSSESLGDRLLLALTRLRAWILVRTGDDEGAAGLLASAMDRLEAYGSVEFGLALLARAELRRRQGDGAGAVEDEQRADELFASLGVVTRPSLLTTS